MKSLFKQYDESEVTEKCGFIIDKRKVVVVENVAEDPTQGFEIRPEHILQYIDSLKGIWHTHPQAPSVLSGQDKQCIEQWPDVAHYIIGNDGIRKYIVEEGVVLSADYIPR